MNFYNENHPKTPEEEREQERQRLYGAEPPHPPSAPPSSLANSPYYNPPSAPPSSANSPYYRTPTGERGFTYGLDQSPQLGRSAEEHRRSQNPYQMYGNNPNPPKKNKGAMVFLVILLTVFVLSLLLVSGFYAYRFVQKSNNNGPFPGDSGYVTPELDPDKPKLDISDRPTNPVFQTPTNGMSIPEIAEKLRPAVVGIVSEGGPEGTSSGSGMIMTAEGYIITNAHVVDGKKTTVITKDQVHYEAKLVGKDIKTDLAVIKIEGEGLPIVEFGKSEELVVGEVAIAIGNPLGMELFGSVTAGIISAIDREIHLEDKIMTLIQTDASINPGNSGGPLVNGFGQVVGINTIKIGIGDYEGLGFAIPIKEAKAVVDSLISFGYVPGRPVLGITCKDMDDFYSELYDVPKGVYVVFAQEGSDAFAQGLVKGDIITKINGTRVFTMRDLNILKDENKAGDTVTLTVYRGGKEFDVKIKLMEAGAGN